MQNVSLDVIGNAFLREEKNAVCSGLFSTYWWQLTTGMLIKEVIEVHSFCQFQSREFHANQTWYELITICLMQLCQPVAHNVVAVVQHDHFSKFNFTVLGS